MIEIIEVNWQVTTSIFDKYLEWLMNILRLTGMTFGSIFLFCFIIWLILNLLLSILGELIPFIRGILRVLEFLLLPGSLLHIVWHIFAAKKLNIPTETVYNTGYGWSRYGIKLSRDLKSLRESIFFFWAPFMNVFVIIGWVVPGMILFQWLDTLIDNTVFYWIWLYILFSLIMFGLPDIADLTNPLMVTIVKTPEFYLFIVFYVIIAPITLLLWGYGLTIVFSLVYAIIAYYEVSKISRKEEHRLAKSYDKILQKEVPVYIIVDSENTEY